MTAAASMLERALGVVVFVEIHVSEVAQDQGERTLVGIGPDRLVDLAGSRGVSKLLLADCQVDVGVAEVSRVSSTLLVAVDRRLRELLCTGVVTLERDDERETPLDPGRKVRRCLPSSS